MWASETSIFVAAVAEAVTAVIAVAAAIFAWLQVREARRSREAQTQPFVVVDIEPGRVWMNWLTLVIENVGPTLAKEVKVTFDPPLTTTVKDNLLPDSTLLLEGIAALPPGRRVETLFDLSHDRLQQGLPMRYRVTVSFLDFRGRAQESLPYDIDLSYLYDLEKIGEKNVHDLVNEVAKLRKELEQWRDGDRGLLVRRPADVYRAAADRRWQYALTGRRRSMAYPGLLPGFGWPARLPLVRELLYKWRTRRSAKKS